MKKYIIPFALLLLLQPRTSGASVTIPVVVHVLYYDSAQNISDTQIQSQIDVLNQDYNALNPDIVNVPAPFQSVIGNPNISFCLATRTPDGNWTTGIERRQTSDSSFEYADPSVMDSSLGGLNAWDRSSYLNIWVCNLSGGLLGYAQLPGGPAAEDGCVILYSAFGNTGTLLAQYNKGRTTTREIGHWLGLYNIPYEVNSCSSNVADIPPQANIIYGCPEFPYIDTCSSGPSGAMFMNFMEWTDDSCMYMFTIDQATRMNNIINSMRTSILTSNGCTPPTGINEINAKTLFELYPNPATNQVTITSSLHSDEPASVFITDVLGREVLQSSIFNLQSSINISSLPAGVYFLQLHPVGWTSNGVKTESGSVVKKFVKE